MNQFTSWREPRNCEDCGKEYFPQMKRQKYCTRCTHNVSNRIWQRKRNKTKPENFRGKYKKVKQ